MQNNLPLVSFIIACRNEQKYIGKCLDSLTGNDYPKESLEILVMDGMSEDKTRDIVKGYIARYSSIKIFDNPRKHTHHAFNEGVKRAKGDVIMIGGAHAAYEKDYISKCVKYLQDYKADNVGGILKTMPLHKTVVANGIAICLSSFFGAGGAHFRMGLEKPTWVDTVFGGCYRKEVFEKIGLFNENLEGSHDIEFNLRLKKAGGKILLAPDIVAYYYPSSTIRDFFVHNLEDGVWATLPLKFTDQTLKLRHYIPLMLILTLPVSLWFYIPASLCFSAKIALQEKDIRYFLVMPIVYGSRHVGYGLGSLWGLIKVIF